MLHLLFVNWFGFYRVGGGGQIKNLKHKPLLSGTSHSKLIPILIGVQLKFD